MYDHDPEVPAGFQEADFLQAQYEEEGRRIAALTRQGVCTHGWLLGPGNGGYTAADIARMRAAGKFPDRPTDDRVTDQASIPTGSILCTDCGALIDDPFAR